MILQVVERTERSCNFARQTGSAIDAPIAGIDTLPARDGRHLVLEVNAVPGWKGLSRALRVNIAAEVLAYLQQCVQRRAE